MGSLEDYEAADKAFRTKAILSQDSEVLLAHLNGLSNQNNTNTGTQHRDIIRGITINNILLQRHINSLQSHITSLDAKNSKLQWWVMALAIAALVGTVVQTITALLPYAGILPPEKQPSAARQVSTPNQAVEPTIPPPPAISKTPISSIGGKPCASAP